VTRSEIAVHEFGRHCHHDQSKNPAHHITGSKLAPLRTDAPLFKKVETLRWRGPTPAFAAWAKRMEAPRLLERCDRVKLRHAVLRE